MFNLNDPFFRPLWLRIAIVVIAGGWAVFEYASGSPGWAVMFGAVAAYAVYGFFVAFDPEKTDKDDENG